VLHGPTDRSIRTRPNDLYGTSGIDRICGVITHTSPWFPYRYEIRVGICCGCYRRRCAPIWHGLRAFTATSCRT
jgi:hypothetical protein